MGVTPRYESKGFYRISTIEKVSYGFGDAAQSLIYSTISSYIAFYYSDVYILGGDPTKSAGFSSYIMFITRILDIIFELSFGVFIDKHHPPFGKYRCYLLFGGIPLTLFSILCYWDYFRPSILYVSITYLGATLCYTIVNLTYSALNASITRDNQEIISITSVRLLIANIGGFFVYTMCPVVVGLFSGQGIPLQLVLFNFFGSIPEFIFVPLVPFFKRTLGKRGIFYVFGSISMIGYGMIYPISQTNIESSHNLFMVMATFIKSIGLSVMTVSILTLVIEVITYSESVTSCICCVTQKFNLILFAPIKP